MSRRFACGNIATDMLSYKIARQSPLPVLWLTLGTIANASHVSNMYTKTAAISFSILLAIMAGSFAQFDAEDVGINDYRHWTTSDGKRSDIRLRLVDQSRHGVRLQREDNNKIITLPLSKLSLDDRQFLKQSESKSASTSSPNDPRESTGDWPQWRGVHRDGISSERNLLKQWPSGGPNLAWTIDGLGEGFSSPAIMGGKIYLLGTEGNEEYVIALQLNGKAAWKSRLGTKAGGGGYPGPRGTPTVDGDHIYAIGSDGTLGCFRREGGVEIWRKNLKNDFGGRIGRWDYSESPLVDGDKLICSPGGDQATMVALNKSNGTVIWNGSAAELSVSQDGYTTAAYASPIVAMISGTRQYITFLHGGIVSFSAIEGQPLWHYDAPANGTANCSTPVTKGDFVFAASGYGTGGGKARISRRGRSWNVEEVYFVNKMQSHHGGFVLVDDFLYGTNDSVLLCIDWNTGAIKWQDRSVGKGSIAFADGMLYVRGENGELALVEATPTGYREKGRFQQPDRSNKRAWPHPVVAAGKLYLHDWDRLLCYELR